MRAHYLQHVAFEGLGSIESYLCSAGYEISVTRLFESEELPKIDEISLLIIMGGPMSVKDEDKFPWLVAEKRFIREAIEAGIPVIGICLGAQLIASALGAEVYRAPQKEIGWFPIEGVSQSGEATFRFPESMEVFHWHGETFDLPSQAALLARSAACKNQAFQIGRSVIGLQFHLETTPESLREIVDNCRHELIIGPYVQSEENIIAAGARFFTPINGIMSRILAYLLADKQ